MPRSTRGKIGISESLFGNDRLFRTLLDNLSEGVYFSDLHRRIQYRNKGSERITGFTAEEVMRRCCADNILMHKPARVALKSYGQREQKS